MLRRTDNHKTFHVFPDMPEPQAVENEMAPTLVDVDRTAG